MGLDTYFHHKLGKIQHLYFFMNLIFNITALICGLATNSVATLSDCIHDLSEMSLNVLQFYLMPYIIVLGGAIRFICFNWICIMLLFNLVRNLINQSSFASKHRIILMQMNLNHSSNQLDVQVQLVIHVWSLDGSVLF